MKHKKTKSIVIIGRRWFDKVNGNTYFSSSIFVNGEFIHLIEFEYGYGDHYIDCAGHWLADNKYIRFVDNDALWQHSRENNISLITHVSDVGRKKDLS